jgi:cytochrome c peroxidase
MKTKLSLSLMFILVIAAAIISCKKTHFEPSDDNTSTAPVLPEKPYNYSASPNDHKATLGRVLFYDKNLSLNNSVSCASCHQQSKAFCDNKQFSTGLEDGLTPRNSPTIFSKNGRMFWDGRASSITDLVLRPVKNHVEMKFEDLKALTAKISRIDYYPPLFEKAYGTDIVDSSLIKDALAEFLKNFNFSNNKFNRVQQRLESLNASESLGRDLFFGKAKCSRCHEIESNAMFFDSLNTGHGYGTTDHSFNVGLDIEYSDNGQGIVTKRTEDNGKFMVPVLLNIEYTAPYMHDGRFKTLEEVIEHYNSGVKNHPNLDFRLRDVGNSSNLNDFQIFQMLDLDKNGFIDPSEMQQFPPQKLGLTDNEKRHLVDFLKTLSDPSIMREVKFSNPFAIN